VQTASAPAAGLSEPAGDGFAIQVAALRQRAEADGVARSLATKGYPAYVLDPESGAPPVFRVRVGKFKERSEAESVAARLQQEEQFKPWIVR
jgi:cell division septation protein DedD